MIQQLFGLKALKMWRNEDWMLGPDKRRTILSSLCLVWGLAWAVAAVLIQVGYDYHYLLPYFNGIIFTVFFIASYLILGRSRTSFVVTITLSIIYWFWVVLISLPLFFTDPRPDLGVAFLVPRSTAAVSIIAYTVWGWFWIAFSWLVMIFMPIWNLQIAHGQVFLVGKGYVSRPGVQIEPAIITQLVNAGMNRKLIERYIHFDGPRYMHQQLWASVGNSVDATTHAAIHEFIRQVADPARRIVPPVLWFSAVDNVGVFWDKTQSLAFNKSLATSMSTSALPPDSAMPVLSQPHEPQPGDAVVIDQLVTRDGHPIEVELKFSCSFDPEANSVPEFRRALNSAFKKGGNIRAILDSVVRARSIGVARTYFVELPLQSALTEGTIQRFRAEFPAFMQPLEIFGNHVGSQFGSVSPSHPQAGAGRRD